MKTKVKITTRKWLQQLPNDYQDVFYDHLASLKSHELWDWILDILPLKEAEKILKNLTTDWTEVGIGPYRGKR